MYSIRKDVKIGNGFKYRVKVKAFKHSDDMHSFLNKQDNNDWKVMSTPVKSGTYVERGIPGELINVKSIDPSALAHM
ncbi:hypothetical protein [Kiloniella sp.]|uniref:hypothetical protein n=1 Tax=Kiloniella sp. TaxID=1938587 RepID=UPI003B018849